MGSSSSKVAKGAARKYPSRAPGAATPSAPPRAKPAVPHKAKKPLGTGSKDEAIRADAGNPDFAPGGFSQRLHQMGVAQTNPTYSSSSTAGPFITQHQPPTGPLYAPKSSNVTLTALDARQRIQQQAELEFEDMGRADHQGRQYMDIRTIVDAMQLRDRGVPQKDIEARLSIRPGRLDHIGRQDVLSHVTSPE